ncbi:MAG: OadG family protein [Planctomycetota bacterium]|nr:OadG family protein [Planctomycetota bacterium]MEC7679292.1 OadG family protein [Planctomycetota bacterium]
MATLIKPYLAQATADLVRQENLAEGGTIAVVGLLIVFLVLIFLSIFIATLPKVLDLVGKFLPESDERHPIAHEEHDEDAELELLAAIGFVLHTEFQRQVSTGSGGKS